MAYILSRAIAQGAPAGIVFVAWRFDWGIISCDLCHNHIFADHTIVGVGLCIAFGYWGMLSDLACRELTA